MAIIKTLTALLGLLFLAFIGWLTGFSSFPAIIAGILLLVCGGFIGAKMAGVVSFHPFFEKLGGWIVALSLFVIVWAWASNKTKIQADFQKDGVVPSVGKVVGKAVWQTTFGIPKPTATPHPTTYYPPKPVTAPQPHAPTATFHPFGPDGCYETNLGYEARWSPKDKAMRVYDPGGGSHVEALGKKSPISAFGPGTWRFCKEDPAATGVVIWE